jgi:hypothetical protein
MESERDASLMGRGVRLVKTYALAVFPGEFLQVTFNSSGTGALAHSGGLLVVLALANFGENARFFTGALETTQSDVKRLVFLDLDMRH